MAEHSLVSVVDDDASVRESLPDLPRELGYAAAALSSTEEFLASDSKDHTDCSLLDIAMPGMSGPDLQRAMTHQGGIFRSSLSPETSSRAQPCSNAAQRSVFASRSVTESCCERFIPSSSQVEP